MNKFNKEEVESIFDTIEHSRITRCFTVSGMPAIIISMESGGNRPILGTYWDNTEWVPTKWLSDGRFLHKDHPRDLDLDFVDNTNYAA